MIRRTLRLGIRLGFLAGIALALYKLVQGRRSSADLPQPADGWATPPTPVPEPRVAPEPELITPVMLDEIIGKKTVADPQPPPEDAVGPPRSPTPVEQAPTAVVPPTAVPPAPAAGASVVKKAPPVQRSAPSGAGSVPPPPPARKPPVAQNVAPPPEAAVPPAVEDARKLAEARKAAPVKKATPRKAPPKTQP